MNSFIVKLFVILTEFLALIIIGLIIIVGLYVMADNFFLGLAIAVGGTFIVVAVFGFAAITIEIHKDIRAIRENFENIKPTTMVDGIGNAEVKNSTITSSDNIKSKGKIGNGIYDYVEQEDGSFIATHPSGIKKEFGTKAEMYEYFGEKQKK